MLVPLFLLALMAPAMARAPSGAIRMIDGDTIAVGRERIRILGIDAPESARPRCAAERVLALRAKERLSRLLGSGPLAIERDGRDRYGRTLARLAVGGQDVGAVLVREGFALPWKPGAAARNARVRRWCGYSRFR